MKEVDNNIKELKEELTSINGENKHLHEMVVFLGNELNARMSTESVSIEDSSLFLDNIVNNLKARNSSNDMQKSTQDRVRFLE